RHLQSWGSMRHQLQESCKRGHDTCKVGEACDINCRSRAKEGTTPAKLGKHATSIAGVVQKRARHLQSWGSMRHQLQESCKRGHDTCKVGEACDINCRSRAKEGMARRAQMPSWRALHKK